MPSLKIGIQLASLQLPFKQALHTAAELGAEAVEIDARGEIRPQEMSRTGLRQVRKMLEDRNLRVCAVAFRTRRGYDVADDLQQRVDATKRVLRFAHDLGTSVVVNQVGRVPEEFAGPRWEQLLQTLSDLGAYGQRVGAILAARTGTEEGSDLSRLLAALPPGSLGVNFDPGNLVVNGFSPRAALHALATHVLHVHARDGVRDTGQGRGLETPLGRGEVDFPETIGLLQQHGYRGYFTIERVPSPDAVREIAQAVSYLRDL